MKQISLLFSGHQHRYRYQPTGDPLNFPLIVNSADTYLKCDRDKEIRIETMDPTDMSVKRHTFSIR